LGDKHLEVFVNVQYKVKQCGEEFHGRHYRCLRL
jgi:hypothetical protein